MFFISGLATSCFSTLSLHDALPISSLPIDVLRVDVGGLLLIFGLQWLRKAILRAAGYRPLHDEASIYAGRSEEHTSELQSHSDLVCRLLLEKKTHLQA